MFDLTLVAEKAPLQDFLRPIGTLATVALYRPSLRPLTLAVSWRVNRKGKACLVLKKKRSSLWKRVVLVLAEKVGHTRSTSLHSVQVCAATDPRRGKFVDPDLFGHIIEKMRLAIAQGDTQEPSSNTGFHFPSWYGILWNSLDSNNSCDGIREMRGHLL